MMIPAVSTTYIARTGTDLQLTPAIMLLEEHAGIGHALHIQELAQWLAPLSGAAACPVVSRRHQATIGGNKTCYYRAILRSPLANTYS
jgi:hypothetical protein